MAQSRDACKVIGIYNSDCTCRRAVFLIPGDRFPLCPRCGGSVSWRAVWTLVLEDRHRPWAVKGPNALTCRSRRDNAGRTPHNGWDEV